jgi:diacylglycerol kinase (ATP)
MTVKPDPEHLAKHGPSVASHVPRRALLIVNPNSRRGSEADLHAVVELLEDSGYEVTTRESTSADECARELERRCDDLDLVIVAGGDGTISSAAASLYRHNKPLAILPLGTANDLARSLSIPDDLETAGRLVVDNQLRRIDLGVVNGHYFFNAVNIGLGTQITHKLSKGIKKVWGIFSYFRAFWSALSQQHAFKVTITVDGHVYRQRSIHLTVGNGRYYGGGNIVDQSAEIDSGDLCLYSIKPQPTWKLISLAPLLRLGRQRLAKQAFSICGKHIEVSTSTPLEVHADGELVTHTPAKLEIIPQALAVFAPPKPDAGLETINGGMH